MTMPSVLARRELREAPGDIVRFAPRIHEHTGIEVGRQSREQALGVLENARMQVPGVR